MLKDTGYVILFWWRLQLAAYLYHILLCDMFYTFMSTKSYLEGLELFCNKTEREKDDLSQKHSAGQ